MKDWLISLTQIGVWNPLLYEIFERLMFGDLCLTFCPGLEVVVCFVQAFLAFVSSW